MAFVLLSAIMLGAATGCNKDKTKEDGDISYTVKFENKGGQPKPDDQIVKKDEKVTRPTDPTLSGYYFAGWTKTDNGSDLWDFDNDVVTANITLYARWSFEAVYTVSFEPAGGAPKPADQILKKGEKVMEPNPAPTREYYILEGWSRSSNPASALWNFDNETVEEEMTLHARWKLDDNAIAAVDEARIGAGDGRVKIVMTISTPLIQTVKISWTGQETGSKTIEINLATGIFEEYISLPEGEYTFELTGINSAEKESDPLILDGRSLGSAYKATLFPKGVALLGANPGETVLSCDVNVAPGIKSIKIWEPGNSSDTPDMDVTQRTTIPNITTTTGYSYQTVYVYDDMEVDEFLSDKANATSVSGLTKNTSMLMAHSDDLTLINGGTDGQAINILNGNYTDRYHSRPSPGYGPPGMTHFFTLDFGKQVTVSHFVMWAVTGDGLLACGAITLGHDNRMPTRFCLFTRSDAPPNGGLLARTPEADAVDGEGWTTVDGWTKLGEFESDVTKRVQAFEIPEPVAGQYFLFNIIEVGGEIQLANCTTTPNNAPGLNYNYSVLAEIDIFEK